MWLWNWLTLYRTLSHPIKALKYAFKLSVDRPTKNAKADVFKHTWKCFAGSGSKNDVKCTEEKSFVPCKHSDYEQILHASPGAYIEVEWQMQKHLVEVLPLSQVLSCFPDGLSWCFLQAADLLKHKLLQARVQLAKKALCDLFHWKWSRSPEKGPIFDRRYMCENVVFKVTWP